jgi:hypothetical protein
MMTSPLAWRMYDHTLIFPADSLLNAWILSWDYHTLFTRPLDLFNANIFFPAAGTLALSEHMLGNLLIFGPVMFLTRNPIMAANAVVLASFVLSGVTMFALARSWTGRAFPSFVAGVIWAFAPPRIGQLGHMQLLSVQWIPLMVLFGDRFLRSGSLYAGLLAASFYMIQVLSSYYVGYAASLLAASYIAYVLLTDPASRRRTTLINAILLAVVVTSVIMPLSYPYLRQKRDFGLLSNDPRSVIALSADAAVSFLSIPWYGKNIYQGILGRFQSSAYAWEKWLFPGVLPIMLALIPTAALIRRLVRRRSAENPVAQRVAGRWGHHTACLHLLLIVVSFLMALGPYLVINGHVTSMPMPYLVFSWLVPGFSSMRVPARFGLLVPFGLAVLAGFGTAQLLDALEPAFARRPGLQRAARLTVASLLMAGLVVEFHFSPIPMDPIETGASIPATYRWLARQPRDGAVLEIPWSIPGDRWQDAIVRARYVYFSAYHRQPLVDGYSGYAPPSYDEIVGRLDRGPDRETIDYLGALGVRWVILHTAPESDQADHWEPARLLGLGLTPAAIFGSDIVYQLPRMETATTLDATIIAGNPLPAGRPVMLGLQLESRDRPWARPRSAAAWGAFVEWQDSRSGRSAAERVQLAPPLVVEPTHTAVISLPVHAPAAHGRYAVRLLSHSLGIDAPPVPVEVRGGPIPTSRDAPQLLSVSYVLERQVVGPTASEPLDVRLEARNTGQAVWLASGKGGRGMVRLAWRWLDEEGKTDSTGREPLRYDLFPGQTYVFTPRIIAPRTPGPYTLELGLVSEWVAWFSARGVPPVRLSLTVDTRKPTSSR